MDARDYLLRHWPQEGTRRHSLPQLFDCARAWQMLSAHERAKLRVALRNHQTQPTYMSVRDAPLLDRLIVPGIVDDCNSTRSSLQREINEHRVVPPSIMQLRGWPLWIFSQALYVLNSHNWCLPEGYFFDDQAKFL
jgi:hypothetical protein